MKINPIILIVAMFLISAGCSSESNKIEKRNSFYGLFAPEKNPEIFAEGIISNGFHEHSFVISPNGDEIFYVICDYNYLLYRIVYQKKVNNSWTKPEIASFSSNYSDLCPTFSPDSKKVLFVSKRPVPGDIGESKKYRVWYVEKLTEGYGNAKYLELPLEPEHNIANPFLAINGDLFYQLSHDNGDWDLCISKLVDNNYSKPEKLAENLNTEYNECAPFLSPQNDFILFHSNRPGGSGRNDIYVSFKLSKNAWSNPINLGSEINTSYNEWRPTMSFDGKNLFFSSTKPYEVENYQGKNYMELINMYKKPLNGSGTIFWVNTEVLKTARENMGTK